MVTGHVYMWAVSYGYMFLRLTSLSWFMANLLYPFVV